MIPKTWLMLDNQSTCSVISNKDMLKDIVDCEPAMMHSQGGKDMLTQKGMLGKVKCFYFKQGIANILSLAKISVKHCVFDSANGNFFIVHLGNGKKVWFEQSSEGLYYHDTATRPNHATFSQLVEGHKLMLVDTVAENMEGFSQRQLKGVKMARDAYKTLVFPSLKEFVSMVRNNLIQNFPITPDDIKNAHQFMVWILC